MSFENKKSPLRGFPYIFGLGLLSAALTGCSTWDKLNDTERGAVIGGGSGAVLGSAVSGDGSGALLGGAVGAVGGGLIGHERDRDRRDEKERRRY